MRVVSLFTGIGGLDIGFSAAGFDVVAQVEFDEYCRRVAKRHAPEWWPNAEQFTDVRTFGRKDIAGTIDVICGGFPCQPHSVAGKRKGEEDSRNLWPDFARIIGEFRPRCVLLENVPGIISTGYASHVTAELAALGYDAQWGIISASDAGAPHQRARWFCVAYAKHDGYTTAAQQGCHAPSIHRSTKRQKRTRQPARSYQPRAIPTSVVANSNSKRTKKPGQSPRHQRYSSNRNQQNNRFGNAGYRFVKRRLGRAIARLPRWLDNPRWPAYQGEYQHDWEAPRSIPPKTDKNRAARIKALGNAVVPQLAYLLAVEIRKKMVERTIKEEGN